MPVARRALFALATLLLATMGCADRPVPPRATAEQPCPTWTSFPTDRHSNRDSPYLGCSNAMNLRAMLANPADLDRGRPLGPGDGERAARAVDAYRQGRVKWGPGSGSAAAPGASGAAAPGAGTP